MVLRSSLSSTILAAAFRRSPMREVQGKTTPGLSMRPSVRLYSAAMLAQHVIALQTELHRPKPL